VGGYTDGYDGIYRAVIWKSGAEYIMVDDLDGQDGHMILDFGVASNGDLYVLTYNSEADRWGGGDWAAWRVAPSLRAWTRELDLYWYDADAVDHLAVDGADWYIAGCLGYDGFYYKNAARVALTHRYDEWFAEPDSLFALGGDVWVAGCAADAVDHGINRIHMWKNGAPTKEGVPTEAFGYSAAVVRGICVK
jgi:hypothetical protein